MPTKQLPALPVHGTPGGWNDFWDDSDAVAAAQEQAARGVARTARTVVGADRKPPAE
jgi:hypothetical protein